MSSNFVNCEAGRALIIEIESHGAGAQDIVVKTADGQRPVKAEGSDINPGVIGNIVWKHPWNQKTRALESALKRAEQCGRCVGDPTRQCDINGANAAIPSPQT